MGLGKGIEEKMSDTKEKQTPIFGVKHLMLKDHGDQRGSLTEIFRSDWFPGEGLNPRQANLSISKKGVLRGLHFHRRQTDYWVCVRGVVRAGLVDLRKGSPSWKRTYLATLSVERSEGLVIPPGVAHGYYAPEEMALVYLVDNLYDGTDESGVLWNDEDLGLLWGLEDPPVVSKRDKGNPLLSLLEKRNLLPVFEK